MSATSISSGTSYATPTDLMNYVDPNQLGDWCSNAPGASNRITPGELLTNQVCLAALAAASGEFESAVIRGKKYMPSDFASLTGNNLQYVVAIVCNLAKYRLWARKSRKSKEDTIPPGCQEALEAIKALGDGEQIFAFLETYEAAGQEPVSNITGKPALLLPTTPLPVKAQGFFGERLTPNWNFPVS